MDDTCAVCAEMLEWAAYGQCGHREVCSTCIARLRFICDDRRCCICKAESNSIFVTKALGDFTTMIKDFSIFPVDSTEGQVGPYWYHEGTQAFFDDLHHYKMIAAMCKLSCVVCGKKDERGSEGTRRREKFRNIEQLKSHLFHRHRLFMCSLCLEGRKIFICEQKLYTRAQLNRHINTGDSEVDGSESERGGFMGHPLCEFCRDPFYGDNELYGHMCTKHYICHICQRLHPGQYDYYRDYDDLEIHFRREHFLCEDEGCLAAKFVVYATESEMKRHNVMQHRGRMSRSKRNVALQIPISFQYRRREQDQNGRRCGFNHDNSDSQLSLAILAGLETENADTPRAISSRAQTDSDHRETSEIDTTIGSYESFVSADSEHYSRSHCAEGQNSRNEPLEESSFPPLPVPARRSHREPRNGAHGLGRNTMAAQLRHRNNVTVLNVSQARPASNHQPTSLIGGSSQLRPTSNSGHVLSSGFACSSSSTPAKVNGLAPPNTSSFMQIRSTSAGPSASSSSSLTKPRSSNKVGDCASTSKLVDGGSSESAVSNFHPLSAMHSKKSTTNTQPLPKVEDVNAANKSLVERIRADLEFDADKYSAFKEISSEYRRGLVDTWEYLSYVHQFGLSHLVLELARLCPDAQKQKELVDAYCSSLRSNGPPENNSGQLKHQKSSKKGKEKSMGDGIRSSNGALADSVITSVRELQLNSKHSEEVEVLSKDGYRSTKGKSKVLAEDEQAGLNSGTQPQRVQNNSESAAADVSNRTLGTKEGGKKPRKKTSKFRRVRLGESSSAAALNLKNPDPGPDLIEVKSDGNTDASDGLPVLGAWRNGGGQKLVANWRR